MRNSDQPPAPADSRRVGAILLPIGGILLTVAVLIGSYFFARGGLRTYSAIPTIPFPVLIASPAPVLTGTQTAGPGPTSPNGLYMSTDVPHLIPDDSRAGALSHLTVPDRFFVGSVRLVQLQVAHPDTGDLIVKLLAPDLTLVPVLTRVCTGTRNWAALTLDDQAPAAPGTACADNLTATWRPDPGGQLAAFRGAQAQGDWVLDVIDTRPGNVGTLQGWGLQFTAGSASTPAALATGSPTATVPARGAAPTPGGTGGPTATPAATP